MAKFIKLKGLKEGEINFNPQVMEIPDKDIHRYEKCNWFKEWAMLEETEQTNVSIKNNKIEKPKPVFVEIVNIDEPVINEAPFIKKKPTKEEIKQEIEIQSEPKKRGRKPKKD